MKKTLIVTVPLLILIGVIIFFKAVLMPGAEAVITAFHQHYDNKDFGYIYREMTSEEFKRELPYASFTNYMNKLYDRFGKIEKTKRVGWGIFYKNVGQTFNLKYDTVYEKGELQEYFTLLKQKSAWLIFIYDPRLKK